MGWTSIAVGAQRTVHRRWTGIEVSRLHRRPDGTNELHRPPQASGAALDLQTLHGGRPRLGDRHEAEPNRQGELGQSPADQMSIQLQLRTVRRCRGPGPAAPGGLEIRQDHVGLFPPDHIHPGHQVRQILGQAAAHDLLDREYLGRASAHGRGDEGGDHPLGEVLQAGGALGGPEAQRGLGFGGNLRPRAAIDMQQMDVAGHGALQPPLEEAVEHHVDGPAERQTRGKEHRMRVLHVIEREPPWAGAHGRDLRPREMIATGQPRRPPVGLPRSGRGSDERGDHGRT